MKTEKQFPKRQHGGLSAVAENAGTVASLLPPSLQLKASSGNKLLQRSAAGNGEAGDTSWKTGGMYVAIQNAQGSLKRIPIIEYRYDPQQKKYLYRFSASFKEAVDQELVPEGFKNSFSEAMKDKEGKYGVAIREGESRKDGIYKGLAYWIRQNNQPTVIGIFPDEQVKISTARTFYHVNDPDYGQTINQQGVVDVNKSDNAWSKRLDASDRDEALDDLANFDGMKFNGSNTNLLVTPDQVWDENSEIDGKELLIHEILSHLSVPEYDISIGNDSEEIYSTDYQHKAMITAGQDLDVSKHDHKMEE